jgi:exosortase
MGLMLAGALLYSLAPGDLLWVSIAALVLMWTGGFALCYGLRALRAALFPALFLFLMVPVPDAFLNHAIVWLQQGSAEVSYVIFRLVGVPISRSGFVFDLPGITIEVAEACSGIRSSVAVLIISLLAGHLFLRSAWTKMLLLLATLPLLVVKNGIRIVTLSLLSIYVNPSFLTGSLHRQGGILFFLLALGLLVPAVALLQRAERSTARGRLSTRKPARAIAIDSLAGSPVAERPRCLHTDACSRGANFTFDGGRRDQVEGPRS